MCSYAWVCGSVEHWLGGEVHWTSIGDFMGGIVSGVGVGAFTIECVG